MAQVAKSELATETISPAPFEELVLQSVSIITGTDSHNEATIRVHCGSASRVLYGEQGVGPVDAICHAFEPIAPGLRITFYSVKATSKSDKGADAEAKASVTLENEEGSFSGDGFDKNTMVATAKAVVNAINKLLFHRHRKEMVRR